MLLFRHNDSLHGRTSIRTRGKNLTKRLLRHGFRTVASVKGGGNDASGITGTFPARIEAFQIGMLQRGRIPWNAHGRAGARFATNELGIRPCKSPPFTVKLPQPFPHAPDDAFRKQFMKGMGYNAGMIAGRQQGRGNAPLQKVLHLVLHIWCQVHRVG